MRRRCEKVSHRAEDLCDEGVMLGSLKHQLAPCVRHPSRKWSFSRHLREPQVTADGQIPRNVDNLAGGLQMPPSESILTSRQAPLEGRPLRVPQPTWLARRSG
jgi:hypothetical protein